MKTKRSNRWPASGPRRDVTSTQRAERGISLLIILALLAAMALIIAANSTAIALLKHELKLIDQHQLKKYGQGPGH